jgi:hypothetical protein
VSAYEGAGSCGLRTVMTVKEAAWMLALGGWKGEGRLRVRWGVGMAQAVREGIARAIRAWQAFTLHQ